MFDVFTIIVIFTPFPESEKNLDVQQEMCYGVSGPLLLSHNNIKLTWNFQVYKLFAVCLLIDMKHETSSDLIIQVSTSKLKGLQARIKTQTSSKHKLIHI